jgi:hypothetical protein
VGISTSTNSAPGPGAVFTTAFIVAIETPVGYYSQKYR